MLVPVSGQATPAPRQMHVKPLETEPLERRFVATPAGPHLHEELKENGMAESNTLNE